MKITLAGLLCTATLMMATPLATAGTLNFAVSIDTAALEAAGSPPGPFAVDFQLTGGDPLSNTATISNFTFGGGSASTTPPASPSGLVSGDLSSSVTLTDDTGDFFNEFFQGFVPGSTLGFDVALTTNVNGPPDSFAMAILDGNLFNLPTTNFADALVLVNIGNSSPEFSEVQTFTTTGPLAGVGASASPIPEPASALLLGMGLGLIVLVRRWAA